MKRITLTCPFTGVTFEATETADGDIIAYNPLSGEEVVMKFNTGIRHYYMRPGLWREIETHTLKDAAELLNVSVQRVSAMVKNGTIPAHVLPNGDKVILQTDIDLYNENKTYGRPRKDAQC